MAMTDSIHTVRWVKQLVGAPLSIRLFSAYPDASIHPSMPNIGVCSPLFTESQRTGRAGRILSSLLRKVRSRLHRALPWLHSFLLLVVIRFFRPDIVHSLETQGAGYLCLEVKKRLKNRFPIWIHTNWGSDIYLFGRLPEHKDRIRFILENCDYYSCECERDVSLARQFGFKGQTLPVFPNAGGFNLDALERLRGQPPSTRKMILVKGYQGWAGRSLVGLRALERCADVLSDFQIRVFAADNPEVRIKVALMAAEGMDVEILPHISHEDLLSLQGKARIYIGLSISDGISTSLLEAMVMGVFPIQSCTACANEWISSGKTGFIVPPEDPEAVEQAIRFALANDELVDKAAEENWSIAQKRLQADHLTQMARGIYASVMSGAVNDNVDS